MSRLKKKLLGLATIWPFGYMFVFVGFIFLMILTSTGGGNDLGAVSALLIALFMVAHFITIFLILGLQIYYIILAIKNEALSQNAKIGWILAFFFGSLFAMPIYWYIAIWKSNEVETAGYGSLKSGSNFDPAHAPAEDFKTADPVPRKPHSWR